MKKGIIMNKIFAVIIVAGILMVENASAQESVHNPLDSRLDMLMAKMSMKEKIEQLYYLTDGNERLKIPQFKGSDGPHGIGNNAKGFSSFPVTIGMAATWDPGLITRVGRAISLEQAARGKDRIAGPALDMMIDPRVGRASETIGEDPFLGGRISAAFVSGQNTTSVFGSLKHYNLNTYELNRRTNDYLSDQRSLVEFWGAHWKRTIQYGGALSIMCAYNWVNGDKCAENKFLIKDLLREAWGYNFYTMCDWGGFSNTGKALDAELDFCEGNDLYIKELPEGIKSGKFDTVLVNRAVRNVLRTKILSGMLDGVPAIPESVIDGKDHRALVYESGLKSLVMLKNQQAILPLNRDAISSLAVIGPNAGVLPLDGNSSSKVSPSYTIPVYAGIKNIIGADKIQFAKGCNINDKDTTGFAQAIEAARKSSHVVFVAGLDSTVEGEGYFLDKEADEKGGGSITRPDRASQTVLLPGMQNRLINEIARVNPNIILVVISGGICSVTPVIKNVKGLLYAFYPGQEAGRAIADVLFGNYNPSGKLPVTMPKDDSQIIPINPDFRDMVIKGAGYRWFDRQQLTPEFAFGTGISYSDFEYSNLQIHTPVAKLGEVVEASFDLKNTGHLAGEEVAQLYLSTGAQIPSIPMPEKQLRGFQKIMLQAGETKRITMRLSPEELYVYNEQKGIYEVPLGEYLVRIGGASDKLPLKAPFTITPAPSKPDLLVTNIRTMPAFPKPGSPVTFMASVLNAGTSGLHPGQRFKLRFYVNGKEVAEYRTLGKGIPAGGMEMAVASGERGKEWIASNGKYIITAKVEMPSGMDLNIKNDSCQGELFIPNGRVIPKEIATIIQ
ncbi:MAG: glycosyl hydrolase [Pedobacter sp.]|nr:MAG: glycosyl hydrolase [Pedobacter sp.]